MGLAAAHTPNGFFPRQPTRFAFAHKPTLTSYGSQDAGFGHFFTETF
jgi:hypothetical protein